MTPRQRRWRWCGRARPEALMKGSLHTDELMGAVVARDTGIRTERRISHCFIMDVPGHADPLIITDAAVNIAPTLRGQGRHRAERDRSGACRRASRRSAWRSCRPWRRSIRRCRRPSRRRRCARWPIAVRSPGRCWTVRWLSTTPSVPRLPRSSISSRRWPGRANVLVVPDLEAGNMLAKSLSFLGGADSCRHRSRCPRADHPDQPGGHADGASCLLRAGLAGGGGAPAERCAGRSLTR